MTDNSPLDAFTDTAGSGDTAVDGFDPHRTDPETHPEECLVFTIKGQWGHFKRIDGNLVKETYRIPPRTTVAGLIAAILGIKRNSYYTLFARGRSAVAVESTTALRTINMPMNALSTANSSEGLTKVNSRGGGPTVAFTDPSYNRQQHNYELLVEPAYHIYVWLEDEQRLDTLDEMLAAGKSHYTPSLGVSEHLASVEYVGRRDVVPINEQGPISVDTAVPNGPNRTTVTPDTTYRMERSPGYMSLTKGTSGFTRRQTDAFIDYTYTLDGSPVRVTDASDAVHVGEKTVIFR